jgi:hypothetical protein
MAELLKLLFSLPVGRWCRVCHEPIAPDDPFGLSEHVCRPCREN